MTGPLAQQIARLHTYIDTDGLVVTTEDARAALSVIERHVQDMERMRRQIGSYIEDYVESRLDASLVLPAIAREINEVAALPAREKGTETP